MSEEKSRSWKKIVVFYALTLTFSAMFEFLDLRSTGNVVLITGVMWCPALAAIVTKRLFGESLRELGWSLGSGRWQLWAYVIPLLYALPAYLAIWMSGLGGFYNVEFVVNAAKEYGLVPLATPIALIGYVLLSMSAGLHSENRSRARRGDRLARTTRTRARQSDGLLRRQPHQRTDVGRMAFSDDPVRQLQRRHAGLVRADLLYGHGCVIGLHRRVATTALGERLASGGLSRRAQHVRAADLHAADDDTGNTAWYIDEFGAGLAITTLIGAIIVWRKRHELPCIVS